MKAHYAAVVLCVALAGCSSQPTQTLLKSDPYWVTGELDNGLKYHIYPDKEQPVSVRMIVHAGSLQENEQQKGYAHFVEHMAFNGSENFSENDVVRLFEQAGASFGADLNAYTSYQETLYKLDLPDNSQLEQAITWLRDVGDGLDISPTEVEKEKGVILGEFRYSRKEDKPLSFKFYDHLIQDSLYAKHDPLGTKASVTETEAQGLKDFYQTWYQPQLVEVVIAGDITLSEAIPLVEEKFSSWQRGETPFPIKQKQITYNDNDFVDYVGGSEPPSIGIVIDRGARVTTSHEQQHQLWLDEISQQLIQQRLSDVFIDAALPVQWAFSNSYLIENQRYSITSVAFPTQYREQSQQQFLATLASLRDYGVTENELKAPLQEYTSYLNDVNSNWDNMNGIGHAEGKSAALVIDQQVQSQLDYVASMKVFLADLNVKTINRNLDKLLSSSYFIGLGLDASEDKAAMLSDISGLKSTFKKKGSKPLLVTASNAFNVPEKQGEIVSVKQIHEDPSLQKWTLSNGLDVWYLRSCHAGNQVGVYYASQGGKAALDPSLFPAVEVAIPAVTRSGVGSFTGSQLDAHLKRQDIQVYPFINFTHHGLEISTKKKGIAESFAALNAILTGVKIDAAQLEAVKEEFAQNRSAYLATPLGEFTQMVNKNSYKNSSRHFILEADAVQSVTTKDVESIYHQLFQKQRNNVLVVVADINPLEIKPLVRQYIASLPLESTGTSDFTVAYQEDAVSRVEANVNTEDSSQYFLRVVSDRHAHQSAKDVFMDDMLQRILSRRLTSYVREELSLDYAPYAVAAAQDSAPSNDWFLGAQTAPENTDQIEEAIDKVIADILTGISEEETKVAAKQLVVDLNPMKDNPTQQAWFIARYLIHGYGVNALMDIQGMAYSISSEDMSQHAKGIFGSGGWTSKNIMRPKL
ncbi:M16 family metallopeptidase [Vibrio sp. 99-70-13A1]|uniref:M16 family metallopeptidase n=1 Tax=Vibrio sp. 99-70-13A1 TaxID=2607601 RepID=UPI001493512A|nr:M16 family metallopeptidase [Vibrio sp. 99-70-13A1]NOH95947.1 insulinase family protein [Vibrio sp. 99-70-13A1]